MKLLNNFDTKLDEKELFAAIQEYGQGYAILTKKHRFFLIKTVGWMAFALIVFGILFWCIYHQFAVHLWILISICSAYGAITLVWIIHTLIVIFQCIKNNRVFTNNVTQQDLKSGSFETYIKHSIISFLLQIVVYIISIALTLFFRPTETLGDWINIIFQCISNLLFLRIIVKTVYYVIDYEMDFNIFSPKQFILYRQHGIFVAGSTSIATSTIKIVKAVNTNFIQSLLGYGTVSIHPEGTDVNPIKLHYMTRPKILVKQLNEFIDESKRFINIPVAS
ncbi:MAG: hypothetical protein LBG59_04195 [Candidatus Peribacteria bacterium]|jgi:hypothetical protein|nr:hypothetical protein [Candidatus Peribacteria bacterium]